MPGREPTPSWALGAGQQKVTTATQDQPQDTPSLRHAAAIHTGLSSAIDALERGTLSERVAWLHAVIVAGSSWRHVVREADNIAAAAREAAVLVEGVDSPPVPATDEATVRSSLAEKAERSSLTGRFVANRRDVLGGHA